MRILSSDVAMQANHASSFSQKQKTSITAFNTADSGATDKNRGVSKEEQIRNVMHLSQFAQQQGTQSSVASTLGTSDTTGTSKADATDDKSLPPDVAKMKQAVESLIAWMSGKTVKMQFFSQKDIQPQSDSSQGGTQGTAQAPAPAAPPAPTWGAIIQSSSETRESESLEVGMQGAVTTADGRAINFQLSMSMSRSYYSQESLEVRLGAALEDPLVVNFDGQAAQLSLDKFQFDLSGKGAKTEALPDLSGNSGYLAIDKNSNGTIDNGSELFGPKTGNGFTELAQLDDDKNGWIDEGDAAFTKLMVWQPSSDGTQKMAAVGQLGIGAIHASGVNANFDYKDSQNNLQGKMKQAGMFLYEDGRTGTMQQIDIAA